jgi:hypothetical protein
MGADQRVAIAFLDGPAIFLCHYLNAARCA